MLKSAFVSTLGLATRIVVPPYKSRRDPSKLVAIVVPLSARPGLTPEEEISLRHLVHFLGEYDKYFVAPPGVSEQRPGFKVLNFYPKFFGSAAAHNRLLLWPGFYRTFEDYKYILIYHLDSLVFANQMRQWCAADLDYIGAPWIQCSDTPWVTEPRVGNGGFALMRVESVLKVLRNRYRLDPTSYVLDLLLRNNKNLGWFFRILEKLRGIFPNSRLINRPLEDLRKSEKPDIHGWNNDFFWSFRATEFLKEFKVASVEQGLRFAFEGGPRICFELSNHQMPFGCHAWAKYDRAFWEPHLLPVESDLERVTTRQTTSTSVAGPFAG